MDEWGSPDTREEFDAIVARIPTAPDPYAVALEAAGCAVGMLVKDYPDSRPYLLWACFTDWVELGPEEEESVATAAMRDAALEWRRVKDDPASWDRYFDHWMYDVMDVKHAVPQGWTMRIDDVSTGVYKVTAQAEDGRSASATGTDRVRLTHEVGRHAYELSGEYDPLATPSQPGLVRRAWRAVVRRFSAERR